MSQETKIVDAPFVVALSQELLLRTSLFQTASIHPHPYPDQAPRWLGVIKLTCNDRIDFVFPDDKAAKTWLANLKTALNTTVTREAVPE